MDVPNNLIVSQYRDLFDRVNLHTFASLSNDEDQEMSSSTLLKGVIINISRVIEVLN